MGAATLGVDHGQLCEADAFGQPVNRPARQILRQRLAIDQPLQRPLAPGCFERQFFAVPFYQRSVGRIDDPGAAGLR